jgi:membrane-bound serine protease (ClpP class)
MRRLWLLLLLVTGLAGLTTAPVAQDGGSAATGRTAMVIEIDGPIGPATSDYVLRGLDKAQMAGAAVVILRIDTPGGLDTSMREIIRAILASPVPVVSYVAPSGARAASAGTYILYASHVAAMAPGTNLGAATPVQIGAPGLPGGEEPKRDEEPKGDKRKPKSGETPAGHPGLTEKATNDAIAYIRSLAQLRGRNVAWAEKAVREAASLPAEDALKQNVVEIIAPDLPTLLQKLDGRKVSLANQTITLATAGAAIVTYEADWRTKLLAIITNPNVASLLMLIGVYGLIIEFYSPGLVGPGVLGAICLLLALYAFHVLPVDYTGVALIVLGIGLMVAEAFIGAFGVVGLGGVAAFVIGAVMLMKETGPGFTVAWELVGGVALALGGLFLLLTTFVVRARNRPVVAGREEMVGSPGGVLDWQGGEGSVRVRGERWHARASVPLARGQQVRVTGIHGLTLDVEPDETRRD